MDDRWRRETRPLVLKGGIHMPYSWTMGRTGSRFFIGLRDHGIFMASPCPRCRKVWMPPRLRCPICLVEIEDNAWIEVGPEGTLKHFTIVRYEQPAQPLKPPFAYGLIDLEGADCAFAHIISGTDLDELKPGTRVKPIFKAKREGNILDIAYFTPVGGEPK